MGGNWPDSQKHHGPCSMGGNWPDGCAHPSMGGDWPDSRTHPSMGGGIGPKIIYTHLSIMESAMKLTSKTCQDSDSKHLFQGCVYQQSSLGI